MGRSKPVTNSDIEDALDIAARVIDKFGYKYWPIFERLEAELESRTDREERLRARLGRSKTDLTPEHLK
jgi:hypothetical protein